MKYLTVYLPDNLKNYIEDVAVALDRNKNYVTLKLLEKAIELHKKGEFEI